MKAIILNNHVVDILDEGVEFVAPNPLYSVIEDCPVTATKGWKWDGKTFYDPASPTAYANERLSEYPSIGDQLDALFHAGVFPAEMAAQIQAVKDKYPKGGNA